MDMSSSAAATPTATTFHIGGIPTHVYGLSSLREGSRAGDSKDDSAGLAVLFFLHGRFGHSLEPRHVRPIGDFLATAEKAVQEGGKRLLVVAFDQRNHGARTTDVVRNKGWKDDPKSGGGIDNPSHAGDMMAIQTGTAKDVSFLIDFLELSIFANEEHQYRVTDWWCAGVSLGGHSTWLTLAHDPRVTLGIPIIGSPDMRTLLSARARSTPSPIGPIPIEAPFFPKQLLDLWQRIDPVNVPDTVWKGKKILALSGEDDELVNYVKGGTGDFVERRLKTAVGKEGKLKVYIEPGVGHTYSEEMRRRTCEFLLEEGLKSKSVSGAGQGGRM